MKRLLITGLLFGCAFAVQAQSSASVTVRDDAGPADAAMAADRADEDSPSAKRNCLRQTGSLITARYNAKAAKADQQCVPINGRSYSREELERTGQVDIGDALRRLDPAIR